MPNRLVVAALGAAISLCTGAVLAQDKKQAEKKQAEKPAAEQSSTGGNTAMCIGCHGIPGYKTAYPMVYHVPMIAGQQRAYIIHALKAYKSGERSHPSMRGIAASLTEKDMESLAAYYAGPAK